MNALVVDARCMLEDLLAEEYRGPGDMAEAIKRLARHLSQAGSGKIWALKYRPPKTVDMPLYLALCEAHAKLKATPGQWHRHERQQEAPRTVVGRYLTGLAAALDRANASPVGDEAGR